MMEHLVRIAHHAVASGDDSIVTVGLGSCVAIAVHDVHAKVGGLAFGTAARSSVMNGSQ